MKKLKIAIPALLLVAFHFAGCNAKRHKDSSPEQLQSKHLQFDSIQKIVASTRQRYKVMNNAALLKKLAEQSKRKKEPFNAPAYRELKSRENVNPDTLVSLIHELKNRNALLPLLLLRTLNKEVYTTIPVEFRANVLTDAFVQSDTFNIWGLPGPNPEDGAVALAECGNIAIPALKRALSETRPAPLYGSQEHMIYVRYHFRLCDYALVFIKKIQGEKNFAMPVNMAQRDSLIRILKR